MATRLLLALMLAAVLVRGQVSAQAESRAATTRAIAETSATLTGRLVPAEILPFLWRAGAAPPELRLEARERSLLAPGSWFPARVPLQRDGTFRREGLAPGSWDVFLHWHATKPLRESLGVVKGVRAGERRDVEIRAAQLCRHELVATVLLDERPFANGYVKLVGTSKHVTGEARECVSVYGTTNERGQVSARVEPGIWQVSLPVRPGRTEDDWYLPSVDSVEVRAGARADTTLHVRRTNVVVTLRDASGKQVADEGLDWSHSRLPYLTWIRTDARGVAVLESVPMGTLTVRWCRASGEQQFKLFQTTLGTFEIANDRPEVAIEVRLPPTK